MEMVEGPKSPRTQAGPENGSSAPTMAALRKCHSENMPKKIVVDHFQHGYRVNRGPIELVQPDTNELAPPYPLCSTEPYNDLDSFGMGISLYFRQVLMFLGTCLLGAIILIAATAHNAETCKHGGTSKSDKNRGLVRGSAAGCFPEDLKIGDNIVPDLLVCVMVLLLVLGANRLEEVVETRINLSQQTPSDYSVQVSNPPDYVDDPDKYYEFFSDFYQNGQNKEDVVAVTMSKDNGGLMQLLAERRSLLQDKADLDARDARRSKENSPIEEDPELNCVLKFAQPYVAPYGLLKTRTFTESEIRRVETALKSTIATAIEEWKAPRRVVVTFATEEAQHRALDAYETSGVRRIISNATGYEFRNNPRTLEGGTVLRVSKPTEPSEIFWHNSHVHRLERWLRLLLSILITAGALAVVCVVAIALRGSWRFTLSVFITLVNATLPPFIKVLTETIERHADFGDLQDSMFLKLTAARWINTAVSIFVSYGPKERLSADALSQVMLILLADAFLTPCIRLVDVYDLFLRYVVAPRQPTLRAAARFWTGAEWNIAERYTDVGKTLFVGLFYAAAMPTSLFVTAAAMVTTFCADRYLLLRRWRRVPELDAQLARRTIGIVAVVVFVHAWCTMFFFLNWGTYSDTIKDEDWNPDTSDRTVHCFVGLLRCRLPSSDQTTKAQEFAYRVYRAVGFISFAVALWKFLGVEIKNCVCDLFCGGATKQRPDANLDNFRVLPELHVYVPMMTNLNLDEPVLAANVDGVPAHLLPVTDPQASNVATRQEIQPLLGPDAPDVDDVLKRVFGRVKYYEPPVDAPAPRPPSVKPPMPPSHPPPVSHGVNPNIRQPSAEQHAALHAAPPRPPSRLPPGWSAERDPGTGRVYYLDHINKKTQWVPPNVAG